MVVLITGCRSGFGLRTAITAAQRGHTVYAGLRDLTTAGRLREAAEGLPVHPVQLDVTDATQREAVISAILTTHGHLDALINNAGIILGGSLEMLSEDEVRRVFEVNVFAVWALTRAVLPAMRGVGSGAIINVSSASGRIALPGLGAYAGSKFALEGMTESLRHEVAPFGIRVALIEPGPYKTDMMARNRAVSRNADRPDNPYAPYTARAEDVFQRSRSSHGDPQDVADRIVSLLDRAAFPLRHPMGFSAKARLAFVRMAPFALWEALLRRVLAPR